MKNIKLLVVASLTGVVLAAAMTSSALAWHPEGKIVKYVQNVSDKGPLLDADTEMAAVNAKQGDTLKYVIEVRNDGATGDTNEMHHTVMTDTLPAGVELVGDETRRTITANLGVIKPGQKVTKEYTVKVTAQTDKVIKNEACFTGDSEVYDNPQDGCNPAYIKVKVVSEAACVNLVASALNTQKTQYRFTANTKVSGNASLKGAEFSLDGGQPSAGTVQGTSVYRDFTLSDGKEHTVKATVNFTIDGKNKQSVCEAKVTAGQEPTPPAATPTELPKTGAGSAIVPALLAAVVGYVVYAVRLKRRALQG